MGLSVRTNNCFEKKTQKASSSPPFLAWMLLSELDIPFLTLQREVLLTLQREVLLLTDDVTFHPEIASSLKELLTLNFAKTKIILDSTVTTRQIIVKNTFWQVNSFRYLGDSFAILTSSHSRLLKFLNFLEDTFGLVYDREGQLTSSTLNYVFKQR